MHNIIQEYIEKIKVKATSMKEYNNSFKRPRQMEVKSILDAHLDHFFRDNQLIIESSQVLNTSRMIDGLNLEAPEQILNKKSRPLQFNRSFVSRIDIQRCNMMDNIDKNNWMAQLMQNEMADLGFTLNKSEIKQYMDSSELYTSKKDAYINNNREGIVVLK